MRLVPARRPKLRPPARKLPCALTVGKPLLPRRPGKVMGRTARFIGPRATTFKSVIRLSSLRQRAKYDKRGKEKVRLSLAVRVEAVK